jgi:hypothetical protein
MASWHALDALSNGFLLRQRLDPHFAPETALPGTQARSSAGHCAAVALIFYEEFGGEFVSAIVNSSSHWFNRISSNGMLLDVDLTGDQFGFPAVRAAPAETLFPATRVRRFTEVCDETLTRAARLASRAGLSRAKRALMDALRQRAQARQRQADGEPVAPRCS